MSEAGDHNRTAEAEYQRRRRRAKKRRHDLNVDLSDSSNESDQSESLPNQTESDQEEVSSNPGDELSGNSANSREDDFVNENAAEQNADMDDDPESDGEGGPEEIASESDIGSELEQDISDNSDSGETDDSEEHEYRDNADRLFNGSRVTVVQFMLALLTLLMRHKLTCQCFGDVLSLIEMICPPDNRCFKTLFKFKKYFSMIGRKIVEFHYFCANCESSLQEENSQCVQCAPGHKVNFFLGIPLINQLQAMFLRPGFYNDLLFRFQRVKKSENNLEDIYDGEIYKNEMREGFLNNQNHISFMWYTDGISIFKSTNFSVWPMYLVINELNYKKRTERQNILVAGIWFGNNKPNPNVFLQPLHSDLEKLKTDGHLFQIFNSGPALIRGKMLCGTCDLQAKCKFLKFKQWNGFFGCCFCMVRGERYQLGNGNSIHVYPYSPVVTERKNEDIPGFAEQAVRNRRQNPEADVYGVKGLSLLYFMLPNMIKCMAIDAMHGIFLGVMKTLTHLWFDASYSGTHFSLHHLINIVDERLKNLKRPSNVQRLPRSIKSKLAFWKALEYKLWCLYFSLPILLGLLPEIYWQHHCKLVSAISILHQESISLVQLDVSRNLLHSYLADFQQLYSLRFMSVNFHQLVHLPDVVRNLGPLWVYNCFFLEDLNGGITRLVHGSRHAAMQICSSVSAFLSLPARLNELNVNDPVRLFCERMLISGQTRFAVVHEIDVNTQVVSRFRICNPIPPLVADALAADFNILGGHCVFFHKLRKKGVIYVASSDERNMQKSCYAVLTDRDTGIPHLCKILHFLKWTPCQGQDVLSTVTIAPRDFFVSSNCTKGLFGRRTRCLT